MSLDEIKIRIRDAKDREHHAAADCRRIADFLVLLSDELRGENWKKVHFSNDGRISQSSSLPLSDTIIDLNQFPTLEVLVTTFNEWKQAASQLRCAQQEWDSQKP